jgi:hypothetical protein
MKNLLILLLVAFAFTAQAQSKKDNEAPVISDVYVNWGQPIPAGYDLGIPIGATVTDNTQVYQVIFQIEPVGKTYPAGPQMHRNVAYWQATDFYKQGRYEFTPDGLNLPVGTYTLRVTAYDPKRNETQVEVQFVVQ